LLTDISRAQAYFLAYAQQLKNKDILEGGAKAAILLKLDKSDEYIPELFGPSFMFSNVRTLYPSAMGL
jgi:hypothetical protein